MSICNPSDPTTREEVEKKESLEAHGPTSLAYTVGGGGKGVKKSDLKVKGKGQQLKLFSDLHM